MTNKYTSQPDANKPMVYQVRIKGHLGQQRMDWFEGFSAKLEGDGNTLLSGTVVDQSALHGVLRKIRDLGMQLLSVNRVDADRVTEVDVDQIRGDDMD
jgi:hypothetical protein